jgi:hypothetical protein
MDYLRTSGHADGSRERKSTGNIRNHALRFTLNGTDCHLVARWGPPVASLPTTPKGWRREKSACVLYLDPPGFFLKHSSVVFIPFVFFFPLSFTTHHEFPMAIWLFPCNTRKKKGKSYSILS